jgi:hypothetical protein
MKVSNEVKDQARHTAMTFGMPRAAKYLYNQGVPMEDAMRVLRVWSSEQRNRKVASGWHVLEERRGFVKGGWDFGSGRGQVDIDVGVVADAARRVS